ncbi:sugar lactone lactonase YvrE [Mariniflexile fucanivorans]|uniref:Sugar lactone lactonase YvrE n=1 Tax=Mariniflexile fucanivorans TaxID=264023 RepID=A0A4V2QE94_9FLAO|nr:SMP-30/gluconolactonase/LRE family protein [Mariniflexile fucanivorans]TCL67097.1 sugar lactone lactonase YvrE [Mariniflexile fucanivorans]
MLVKRTLRGMLIYISLSVLLILGVGCKAKAEIKFPVKVGVKPESITKGFKGNYFVTVMNGKENEDGELVEISTKGVNVFSKGFNEPKGIVFIKEHLYFSDINCIWKVDKDGNKSVFVKKEDFPKEVLYLNDVTVDGEGIGFYVADMGATNYMRDENNNLWPLESDEAKLVPQLGRIYHVNLKGEVSIVQDDSPLMLNPNGVGVDNNNNIMVSAFFLGNFLVTKEGELTPLKGQYRGGDGVEQDSKGNYYISSWTQGKVWKIDGKTEEPTVLIEGLKSAADFYLEEKKHRLLVPDMLAGMIYAVDIKKYLINFLITKKRSQ